MECDSSPCRRSEKKKNKNKNDIVDKNIKYKIISIVSMSSQQEIVDEASILPLSNIKIPIPF